MDVSRSLYGKDAREWLARWDRNEIVWSIEMGGLGPSYEQCIQIVAAELLRRLIEVDFPGDATDEDWNRVRAWSFEHEPIKARGITGAMFGAASNIAMNLYRRGPSVYLSDPKVADRLIQVQKKFPVA